MKLGKHSIDIQSISTEVWSMLGGRGAGKTNAAGVMAETAMDAGIQVVVLDQVGVWFGLRLERDGKTPSRFKMPILGGAHGDIGLEPTSGRQVAEALAKSRSSAIIDVSRMPSKASRVRFCADFGESFLQSKREDPSAVMLVLEEAQMVIPQVVRSPSPDIMRCLGAFEEIASVGRNFGIGLGVLSLRPQKTNKEIVNLSTKLFAFRMTGPSERKVISEWVQEKGAEGRTEVSGELPSLKRGQAILWAPEDGIYGVIDLPLKTTYNASETPGSGRAAVVTKPLDLEKLGAAMAKVAETAKANDPKALRATIAALEAKLSERAAAVEAPPPEVIERSVLTDDDRKMVEAIINDAKVVADDVKAAAECIEKALYMRSGADRVDAIVTPPITRRPSAAELSRAQEEIDETLVSLGGRPLGEWRTTSAAPGKGEIKTLIAIAQHTNGVTREQLTVLTGYKRSSRDSFIQRLRAAGKIEERGDRLFVTPPGKKTLGPDFTPLPKGAALRTHVLGTLPAGERDILRLLISSYPNGVDRDVISKATGYKRSSRDSYLQRLRSRELVVTDRGTATASGDLF